MQVSRNRASLIAIRPTSFWTGKREIEKIVIEANDETNDEQENVELCAFSSTSQLRASRLKPSNAYLSIPAGLIASRQRLIHDVVADEEERLQQLDAPAGDAGQLEIVGRLLLRRGQHSVRHHRRQAAIPLAMRNIVFNHL